MKTCSIPECASPVLAKGFCRKHYLRQYKYGDPHTVKKPFDYARRGKDAPQFKHGLWDHPLYKTWSNMMRRCYNQTDSAYKNYGARGIGVCDRWHDVKNFVVDMGARPPGYSIDRIDNDKGYSLENCRWANASVQVRNRRFSKMTDEKAGEMRARRAEGVKRKALAKEFGVSEATVKKVLSGAYWNPEKIAGALKR